MCGRYKRPGKQKIAEAFAVSEGLEAFDLEPDDNACPQSFQPVVHLNENGERQIELMRWAFKLPDKLLFNARSEGIERAKSRKSRCSLNSYSWLDRSLQIRKHWEGDSLIESKHALGHEIVLCDRRLSIGSEGGFEIACLCRAPEPFDVPFNLSCSKPQVLGEHNGLGIPLLNIKGQVNQDCAVSFKDLESLEATDKLRDLGWLKFGRGIICPSLPRFISVIQGNPSDAITVNKSQPSE